MPSNRKTTFADWLLVLFFLLAIAATFLPMVNILARSLSSAHALAARQVALRPVGFTLEAYELIFRDAAYTRSLIFTAILTVTFTAFAMFMTIITAYPLMHDELKGRNAFTIMMIFTMYFSAGMIPNFMLINNLGLLNNPLVLILPSSLSVFNVIIMRAFFRNIPVSLRESAEMEGANPFQILVKIYLPLSTPVLATLALFYAVGRWNGFTDALLFMTGARQYWPIQLLLWNLIQNVTAIDVQYLEGAFGAPPIGLNESLRAATVMFSTVPILLVYPWLQRYFISGVTLGAVKE